MVTTLEALTVSGDDVNLHVVRSPPHHGDGPPLLFVHGYPDSSRTWHHQIDALGATRPVAAFDLRGTGRSSTPRGRGAFRFDRLLADIERVIDAVAGDGGCVHLIGHDWGGALAWIFASDPRLAARLASLTVIAAPHPDHVHALLRQRLARHSLGDLAFVGRQLRRSWYMFAFQIPGLAAGLWARDPEGLWLRIHRASLSREAARAELDPETALRDGTGLIGLYQAAFRRRPVSPPPIVAVPTSMIIPTRDFALLPELYDNAGALVPDLETHFLDANHWVHLEQAAAVTAIIRDFVGRH